MRKNISLIFLALSLVCGFNAQAEVLLKCAVTKVNATQGARVNVLKNPKGDVKAQVIFGKGTEGKMFSLNEIAPGIFQGVIKGKSKFALKLFVSGAAAENSYIRGGKSQLEVVYPDAAKKTGTAYFKSSEKDNFVCGEQMAAFKK